MTKKHQTLLRHILSLFFIASTIVTSVAVAADIQVRVDRNDIELNETFNVVFESIDAVDGDPDFTPLQKDFQVLNRGTSSNISIINGQYRRSFRWSVTLMAIHEGTITIPSIQFGKDASPPYRITVKPVRKSNGASTDAFISELDISTSTALPQQQVIVTQRLLSSKQITAYEFSQPQLSGVDATVEPLGKPKQFQATRGNTPYLVIEHRYAIFPQASGTLNIAPSIASARIEMSNGQSPFDPFRNNTRTIRRASESKTINVKPVPDSFSGKHWLVANEVQLLDDFPQNTTFRAGEPITRTLSLHVDGQTVSQLPEFIFDDIDGLKQYPDQPETNNHVTDNGITASQQLKIAIIPGRGGSYTLPEISIPWWNIKTGKMEVAHLPARSFHVGSATGKVTPPPSTSDSQGATDSSQASPLAGNTQDTQADSSLTWKIISLLLLLAWLATLFQLWKLSRRNSLPATEPTTRHPSLKACYHQLEKACNKNNARAVKTALLCWSNALFNDTPVHSLGDLANRLHGPLADIISELNQSLYSDQATQWQCGNLLTLCREFEATWQQDNTVATSPQQLEPLYK